MIPGTSIKPIHLPRSKECPNCHTDYRKVNQRVNEDKKVTNHCPHCGNEVVVKIPKKK
jgi:hypothetical protein